MKITEIPIEAHESKPLSEMFLEMILDHFEDPLTPKDMLIALAAVKLTGLWIVQVLDNHGIHIAYEKSENEH